MEHIKQNNVTPLLDIVGVSILKQEMKLMERKKVPRKERRNVELAI